VLIGIVATVVILGLVVVVVVLGPGSTPGRDLTVNLQVVTGTPDYS